VSSLTRFCTLNTSQNDCLEVNRPTWIKLKYPLKWYALIIWTGLNVLRIRLGFYFLFFWGGTLKFSAKPSNSYNWLIGICIKFKAFQHSIFFTLIYLVLILAIRRLWHLIIGLWWIMKWTEENDRNLTTDGTSVKIQTSKIQIQSITTTAYVHGQHTIKSVLWH
jgi:hypothetical protein